MSITGLAHFSGIKLVVTTPLAAVNVRSVFLRDFVFLSFSLDLIGGESYSSVFLVIIYLTFKAKKSTAVYILEIQCAYILPRNYTDSRI